jgi:hypothetical protein
MSYKLQDRIEARLHPRLRLPAMYTLLRVKRKGETRYNQTGFIYDISQTGMRFELDEPMELGTELEFRALLPGSNTTTFCAKGTLVRRHDDFEEVGPVRMALHFESFKSTIDRARLEQYIESRTPRIAVDTEERISRAA